MSVITHKQAQQFLHSAVDGLLSSEKQSLLDAHLCECTTCHAEMEKLYRLGMCLQQSFHAHWDGQESPIRNMTTNIQSLKRRINIVKRINMGFGFFAKGALFLVFVIIVNLVFSQLKTSPASVAPTTISPTSLPAGETATYLPLNGIIVFVSEISGNPEIFSIQSDGKNLTNLSNNSGEDFSPTWSSDGKHIAFINKNNDDAIIYIMNPDGSEKIPLTNISNNDISFAWSPDSQKIIYSEQRNGDPNTISLSIINIDQKTDSVLIGEQGINRFLSWSPDSMKIVYENIDPQSGVGNTIYLINKDGSGRQELVLHTHGQNSIASWQDSQHFLLVTNNVDLIELTRISTDGTPPKKIESGNSGIVTWFKSNNNLTYVKNSFQSWSWYRIDGTNTTFLSTWPNYAALCQKLTVNRILGQAGNLSSPNGENGLVEIYCDEGSTVLYLVSNDGSKITPLFDTPIKSQLISASWSPDGQFLVVVFGNDQTGKYDLYLIDIEKTLQDPSLRPLQLTNDNAWKYDPVWQPQLP